MSVWRRQQNKYEYVFITFCLYALFNSCENKVEKRLSREDLKSLLAVYKQGLLKQCHDFSQSGLSNSIGFSASARACLFLGGLVTKENGYSCHEWEIGFHLHSKLQHLTACAMFCSHISLWLFNGKSCLFSKEDGSHSGCFYKNECLLYIFKWPKLFCVR